jgi:uncharacterized protein (DUF1800 family)
MNDAFISGVWSRWEPTDQEPWNLRRVVHLHRRAGFAGTWEELQRDLQDGHEASIDRFLRGKAYATPPVSDRTRLILNVLQNSTRQAASQRRLSAAWFHRMLTTGDPLTERLVLLWHNHFATSRNKVMDPDLMDHQNKIFWDYAQAPFSYLLKNVIRDPAMLIYLDADTNVAAQPNENLAREVMELFTLGVGNYTETDIIEAARALTGWTYVGRNFVFNRFNHDPGEKTVLGRTGALDGDDLLDILLEQPATSQRLAWRFVRLFFGEQGVDPEAMSALAQGLRENNLSTRWAVQTILRSKAFFASENMGTRILGPAELLMGAVRAFGVAAQSPSPTALAEWSAKLGQDLFAPPNVFGWDEGRTWITSRTMVGRTNFATELIDGVFASPDAPVDVLQLAEKAGFPGTVEGVSEFLSKLLWGGHEGADQIEFSPATGPVSRDGAQAMAKLMLASARAQLA